MNLTIRPDLARRALAQPVLDHLPSVRTGPPAFADLPLSSRAASARTVVADAFIGELPVLGGSVAPKAEQAIGNGVSRLGNFFGAAGKALSQTFQHVVAQKVGGGVISLAKKVGGFFANIGSKIGHGLKAAGKTLFQTFQHVVAQKVGGGVISLAKKVGGFFANIGSKIGHGLKAAGKTLFETMKHTFAAKIGGSVSSFAKKLGSIF